MPQSALDPCRSHSTRSRSSASTGRESAAPAADRETAATPATRLETPPPAARSRSGESSVRCVSLRWFQARVFRAQGLLADGRETHHQFRVVVEPLDAQYGADAELRMAHPHPEPERDAGRLILVFVGVGGLRFLDAPAAAVRVGPELVMREVALVARRRRERGRFALDELSRHLVDETRWLAGLVFAEDSAACGARQHEARAGAGHPDVTETPL